MCDACAIIEQGKLLAQGPVEEILAQTRGGGGEAELEIRFNGGEDALSRAERLLLEQPQVVEVHAVGRALRVKVSPPAGTAAGPAWLDDVSQALLSVLVSEGLPVCAFDAHKADLEDAFMTVTRGRVA